MDLPPSYRHPWSLDGIVAANGALAAMGVRFESLNAGGSVLLLDVGMAHLNAEGRVHGGILASLLDSASGFSVRFDGADRALLPAVSLSLTVNFHAAGLPGQGGPLRAQGRVTGGGRRILFTHAEVADDKGRLIASATGVFKRHRLAVPVLDKEFT